MAPPDHQTEQLQYRAAAKLPTHNKVTHPQGQPEPPKNMDKNNIITKNEALEDNGQWSKNELKRSKMEGLSVREQSALECGVLTLQSCGTMRAYTMNLAVIYLTNIAVTTYVIGSYRTLEKRFNLSSRDIAALNTITDAVQVVSVLFVGYFGRKAHKPRVISISVLFCVLGALFYATPYFIYGSKEDMGLSTNSSTGTSLHMCTADQSESLSQDGMNVSASESDRTAYVFVALACICLGVGGSCIRVMGFVYIDENVRAQDTPLYVGLAGAVIPVGPVLGFLLAALCTGLPENLTESELSPDHPGYIGAWWLGFIIIGILILVSGVPMSLFPKHLPYYYSAKLDSSGPEGLQKGPQGPSVGPLGPQQGPAEAPIQCDQEKNNGSQTLHVEQLHEKLKLIRVEVKGFMHSLWQLVCNVTLVMFTLHSVFDILVLMGMAGSLTRYLEIQFNLPAFQANIVTALCIAVPGVLGNVAGGVIMKHYNLGVIGASVINTVSSLALIITLAICMGLGCDQLNVAGNLNQVTNMFDVGLGCNSNCSCVADSFLPVCVDEHLNYLSACHAGCSGVANQTHFMDCGCAGDKMAAVSGMCAQDCPLVVPYIIMAVLSVFSISLARVPSVVLNLRVVQPELKAFSLGIVSFADNLLGFIPAPILFGSLVDSACILWADVEGSQGACLLYDRERYRVSVYGTCTGMQVISFLLAVLTWILVKRDVAAGRYKNIEKEEPPNVNNQTNEAAGGKLNMAFTSHPDDVFMNGHLGNPIDYSISDDLEWETEESMMAGPFSLRQEGITGRSLRYQDLSPSLLSLQSHRGRQEQQTAAPPGERTEDWMMTSAMAVAMELMSATHRYIMDIVQLSGEFSTSVVQRRDAVDILQRNVATSRPHNSTQTQTDHSRPSQSTEAVIEISRRAEEMNSMENGGSKNHETNTELTEADEALKRQDQILAKEDPSRDAAQTDIRKVGECVTVDVTSNKQLDGLKINGMAAQDSEA